MNYSYLCNLLDVLCSVNINSRFIMEIGIKGYFTWIKVRYCEYKGKTMIFLQF